MCVQSRRRALSQQVLPGAKWLSFGHRLRHRALSTVQLAPGIPQKVAHAEKRKMRESGSKGFLLKACAEGSCVLGESLDGACFGDRGSSGLAEATTSPLVMWNPLRGTLLEVHGLTQQCFDLWTGSWLHAGSGSTNRRRRWNKILSKPAYEA